MNDLIKRLREQAMAATQGEWKIVGTHMKTAWVVIVGFFRIHASPADAQHIANFSPPLALALLDVVEAAERVGCTVALCPETPCPIHAALDALAQLEKPS